MRIHCNLCGKPASSEVPNGTVLTAWVECYDCALALPDDDPVKAVLDLARQLPAGLPDERAIVKLSKEYDELQAALIGDDSVGSLTEAADVVYYACKTIDLVAHQTGLTIDQVFALALAKYSLRARPGNPKDDAAERVACQEVLEREHA